MHSYVWACVVYHCPSKLEIFTAGDNPGVLGSSITVALIRSLTCMMSLGIMKCTVTKAVSVQLSQVTLDTSLIICFQVVEFRDMDKEKFKRVLLETKWNLATAREKIHNTDVYHHFAKKVGVQLSLVKMTSSLLWRYNDDDIVRSFTCLFHMCVNWGEP